MSRVAALALMAIALAFAAGAHAAPVRGLATEERIALVIGNAAYRVDALDNPVNDARLVAQSLRQAGFDVTLRENLDRRGLVEALREFGNRLGETTVAVVYYAGHGLQLRDHNYMIPVDAEIHSEDEIPIAGLDLQFILGRMSAARSRINIVILDACRNNPFVGRAGPRVQGLAQIDAPVGTLLAYATAPGKLAADGSGGNGLYATQLARQLLVPGLPVEHVFKRVREAVVRETRQLQVPWESSSLQGEFSFVPGAATVASTAASGNATHIATDTVGPNAAPRLGALPHVGDTWRYRVQDRFRLGDLFLTARVDGVSAAGVAETWSSTADAKLRTLVVPFEPGFTPLPGWTATPPEFAPYLLASAALRPGVALAASPRRIDEAVVPLRASVEGEEDVTVAAGRFRAIKVVLRGQAASRGASQGAVSTEHVVWYAPQVRRTVKYTVATRVGGALREATTFELVEFKLK